MAIKIKIKRKKVEDLGDMKEIAKVVIVDNERRVLLLKRSEKLKKFPGEMDLPGGHLKANESVTKGLEREVKEETGLAVLFPAFYKKIDNIQFFHARYDSQPVEISEEHTDYGFYGKEDMDATKKFEKIAIEILEMLENG